MWIPGSLSHPIQLEPGYLLHVITFFFSPPVYSYVVAAISPSVVVPTMLNLQSRGYGVESGIPTLVVGAASMDVVIVISLFGIFLGLAFSDG